MSNFVQVVQPPCDPSPRASFPHVKVRLVSGKEAYFLVAVQVGGWLSGHEGAVIPGAAGVVGQLAAGDWSGGKPWNEYPSQHPDATICAFVHSSVAGTPDINAAAQSQTPAPKMVVDFMFSGGSSTPFDEDKYVISSLKW
jgi:hypothetical protein